MSRSRSAMPPRCNAMPRKRNAVPRRRSAVPRTRISVPRRRSTMPRRTCLQPAGRRVVLRGIDEGWRQPPFSVMCLGLLLSEIPKTTAPLQALPRFAGIVAAPCPAQPGASVGASSVQGRSFRHASCQRITADRQIRASFAGRPRDCGASGAAAAGVGARAAGADARGARGW